MTTFTEFPLPLDNATALARAKATGRPVVGLLGAVAPVELVLAAGCVPVTLRARVRDWGRSAEPMEDGHEPEMCSLFRQAIDGQFADCDLLLIPGTSDGLRFLYQYLKEMVRQGRGEQVPQLLLYDFMFGRSAAVARYSRQVQDRLQQRLELLGGRAISAVALRDAIQSTNRVRSQWRRLNALRSAGRISGTMAHNAMRAGACLAPDAYAQQLEALFAGLPPQIASATPAPRILLAPSVPLYHAALHQLVEQAGADVRAEDDEWGACRGDAGIAEDGDPASALFDYYRNHACSPRMMRAEREAWLAGAMASAQFDGVLFYIPPSDQSFGWRYPDLQAQASQCGLSSMLLRDDVLDPAARQAIQAQLAGWVAGLAAHLSSGVNA